MKLVLVRHGEAAAGWIDDADPGLSEVGQQQARDVVDRLVALGPLPILTSPLRRCRETAAPLAEIGEQPALVIKIANVFDRCFKGRIVLRRPRRDAFFDQVVDAFDELSLVLGKAEIHVFCTLSPNRNCRKTICTAL